MSLYWSAVTRGLTPYVPGEQPKLPNLIKLNTNENPYGPGPHVTAAILREMGIAADIAKGSAEGSAEEIGANLRLYPDPNADRLKAAIAAHHARHGITPRQVFVGNGSDEVLAHAFLALLKHEKGGRPLPLLFPDITYSFYPVYCNLYGVPPHTLAVDDEFRIGVDDYLAAAADKVGAGGIIFPNPNAPTGRLLALAEIERLVAALPHLVVVVDEAYIDFAGEDIPSAIALVNRYPNLLVVQTLSKSRSLAGLRVGFAIGHADLIEALDRVKNSFNSYPLGRLAIAGATAAFEDDAHFQNTRRTVMATRDKLVADLGELGFSVVPSGANFVFARHPQRDAGELAAALRARSIIVRHFKAARIDQHLRITVGNDAECRALTATLAEILGKP